MTTADLTHPMTPPPSRPWQLSFGRGGPADPVEVWTLSDPSYQVSTVAAALHTDIQLLSNSGTNTQSPLTEGR